MAGLAGVRAPQVRDLAGLGIMLVDDPHGQVPRAERAARQILAANRGLSLRSGPCMRPPRSRPAASEGSCSGGSRMRRPGSEGRRRALPRRSRRRPLQLAIVGLETLSPGDRACSRSSSSPIPDVTSSP